MVMEIRFLRSAACLAALALAACSPIRVPKFAPTPPETIGRALSREDAKADLDALMKTLENVHPDLYAVRSRERVAEERRQIESELPEQVSRMEWWKRLAPLVAGFGDGHTNLPFPGEELKRQLDAGVRLFPPDVAVDEERRLAVALPNAPESGLRLGDRIVEVNGRRTDALLAEWMREFSGESDVYRAVSVSDSFRALMLIHGVEAPFVVKAAGQDGQERTITLAGITRDALQALRQQRQARRQPDAAATLNFTYRKLESGIGYMNFRTMGGDLPRFKKDIAGMFRQVAADGDRALIIDLRANGGGDSRMGSELLRYITAKSYRMNAREEWKMSAEYRRYAKTFITPAVRWLPVENLFPEGRKMFHGPAGKMVTIEDKMVKPVRAEPFFSGAVCMLIGPRTFSSATDTVDAVKTYRLATLLGEETGGRPNTFGEVYPFRLPRSGFAVSVSAKRYVRANGDVADGRGVLPDIVVTQTAADRQAGRDAVLERAKSCPVVE
jgi:C-terminal processing protease CtpA/Prc